MKNLIPMMSTLPLLVLAGVLAPGCSDDDNPACVGDECSTSDGGADGVGGAGATGGADGAGGAGASATGGAGGTGGEGGMAGTGGAGGGTPASCVPWENAANVSIPPSCGVFVGSSGGTGQTGTTANPYRTIGAALAGASAGSVIYVCNQTYNESVTIPSGVTIYGGLDCLGGWLHVENSKAEIAGAANEIAARFEAGSGTTRIYDMAITSPDATDPGASSIAAFVAGGDVELERVDVTAGDGADGTSGATPTTNIGPSDPNDPAIRGKSPSGFTYLICSNNGTHHAPGGTTTNPFCTESVGAMGGFGSVPPEGVSATGGFDGAPASGGGSGGITSTHNTPCFIVGSAQPHGGGGDEGVTGTHGTGATGVGALTLNGWIGADGTDADRGTHGFGGGGAGGRISNQCGAGGAGGGAGGCGGFGGSHGTSAGGSFAVIVFGGTLSTFGGTLTSGNGGQGGDGGLGQTGGVGGSGGTAAAGGCFGGDGGDGGDGGTGGGGLGGHSALVAHSPNVTVDIGATTVTALGSPGLGGEGADLASSGDNGLAQIELSLPLD